MTRNFEKSVSVHFLGGVRVCAGYIWMDCISLSSAILDALGGDVEGLAELTLCLSPIKNAGLTVTTEEVAEHESV